MCGAIHWAMLETAMNARNLVILTVLIFTGLIGGWWALTQNSAQTVVIAAGSRSGEAFVMAQAIAEITQRYHPEIAFEVLETRGSSQNMELLEAGQVQIATIQADTLILPTARLIAPLYPDAFQLVVREDVGRHNAVDKVLGWAYLREMLPLSGHMLVVSGRQSFEIVQKALVAGLPLVAGVSAVSSLAIDMAEEGGMTLVGFVRGDNFVVYAGAERVL